MQKLDVSKVAASASGAAELHFPASLWDGDGNCPGVCEEGKVRKQPGRVVSCAGGSL